jgi:hypothetical protein
MVCCEVSAEAVVRVSLASLAELRRNPGPIHGEPLPVSLLKHADEQTVAGLSAVYQAIAKAGWHSTCFQDWGVIAAPRFLGRPAMQAALRRFAAEGAWGVSPHLIPHRSLHSVSGTVSQALKIHGPNFGVGGGPNATVEALLAATALLQGKQLPGVWVVLSCLKPELPADEAGLPAPCAQAVGLALALTPIPHSSSCGTGGTGGERVRLHIRDGVPDAKLLTRIEEELGGHPSLKRKRSECPSFTHQAPMVLRAE